MKLGQHSCFSRSKFCFLFFNLRIKEIFTLNLYSPKTKDWYKNRHQANYGIRVCVCVCVCRGRVRLSPYQLCCIIHILSFTHLKEIKKSYNYYILFVLMRTKNLYKCFFTNIIFSFLYFVSLTQGNKIQNNALKFYLLQKCSVIDYFEEFNSMHWCHFVCISKTYRVRNIFSLITGN